MGRSGHALGLESLFMAFVNETYSTIFAFFWSGWGGQLFVSAQHFLREGRASGAFTATDYHIIERIGEKSFQALRMVVY